MCVLASSPYLTLKIYILKSVKKSKLTINYEYIAGKQYLIIKLIFVSIEDTWLQMAYCTRSELDKGDRSWHDISISTSHCP